MEGKQEKPKAKIEMSFARSPDGATTYMCEQFSSTIETATLGASGAPSFAPYCELCLPHLAIGLQVGGLATDTDGRIYAATEIGVQVFDPTGRLCGVMTPAARGKAELMTFEGDQLTLWIGDVKYTRKLNATGAKQ